MSLITDIIFVQALRSNKELMNALPKKDVYNTAITIPDDGKDNTALPYIIVSYNGMKNDDSTKDDSYEGETDNDTVEITIAAETREKLGVIANAVRKTIHSYFTSATPDIDNYNLVPSDYTMSAGGVMFDQYKPCMWQILNYACETENNLDYE